MEELIKQLQKFMKTSPAGINYSGPVDGKPNAELKTAANNLQNIIRKNLNNHPNKEIANTAKSFTIMSEDNVVVTIGDIKSLITEMNKQKKPEEEKTEKETDKDKEETDKEIKPDKNIEAVQKMFNSNPIGIKYSGPTDGIPNKELVEKSRLLEQGISILTGANINGKITDGKTIITTPKDLQKTFNLLQEYKEFLKK